MAKAIVIGAGPSLYKFNHLELLAKSDYDGSLLITDRMLRPCLNMGITPDRFKGFYVFSMEDMFVLKEFYPPTKHASKITVIHSPRVRKEVLEYIVSLGYKLKCDYWDYLKVTSNVGLMAFCYGWRVLHLKEIAMIGLDHSIYPSPDNLPFTEDSDCFRSCYTKVGQMIMAPNHQLWLESFIDFLELIPYPIRIINCTEGGVLKDKRIKEMEFRKYLW